jgi:hypothetical protein
MRTRHPASVAMQIKSIASRARLLFPTPSIIAQLTSFWPICNLKNEAPAACTSPFAKGGRTVTNDCPEFDLASLLVQL